MPSRDFITVPDELLEHANAVADWFDMHGYAVQVEKAVIGAPYTPTLTCVRQPTTVHVEVDTAIRTSRVDEWVRYCRSCSKDTRIALGLPAGATRNPDEERGLRETGVGLYLSAGTKAIQSFAAQDMAVNVQLPDLQAMPKKMRKILAPAYEQFEDSHWREGFRKACDALEIEARKYLKKGVAGGRIVVLTEAGNVSNLTAEQIDKLTLGQTAKRFARIQNPNYPDTVIASVLDLISPDRVRAAHHGAKRSTEAALRKNVGEVVPGLVEL